MSSKFKVDIDEYNRLVHDLSSDDLRRAMTYAVRSGANRIRRRTVSNFASGTNFKAYNIYRNWRGESKKLSLVTVKVGRDKQSATVHIMGDFRAKFFEMGTKRRMTKGRKITSETYNGRRTYLNRTGKPANRGAITERRYFRKAQDSEGPKVLGEMQNRMERKIIQIGRKKR